MQVRNDACSGICFNISHTDDLVALGVTHGRALGLDTENVNERPAPLEIADRCFSPREVRDLRILRVGDRPGRFFDYWTLKESYKP